MRDSPEHLEALWQSLPLAVAIVDRRDTILAWNRQAEDLLGLAPEEAIGRPITSLPFRVAGTEDGFHAWLVGLTQETKPAPLEATYTTAENRREPITISGSPIVTAERATGATLVFRTAEVLDEHERTLRDRIARLEVEASERQAALARAEAALQLEVERHRAVEEALVKRNRALLSLQAAAAATASSLDVPFVLETMTWEITDLLDVVGCVVYEWDVTAGVISTISDYAALVEAAPIERKSLDLASHPMYVRTLEQKYAQQLTLPEKAAPNAIPERTAPPRQGLLLPMTFQDRVVGLVELVAADTDRRFTDREISVGLILANQAAVAIEHARLYERAQREISERLRVEQQIKESLREKEMLLQEIHHRVKNNLQVISSLLNLQARTIEDPRTLEVLQESQNRLRSMALIHERLYRSDNLAHVDFGEYLRGLTAYLVRSYQATVGSAALQLDIGSIPLTIERAVPCGLIVNELVSNALKYAFPDGRHGQITVRLHQCGNMIQLTVSDNGIGLPQDMAIETLDSLGLQLVHMLTEQLDGRIELAQENGTQFTITFPQSKTT